MMYTLDTIPAWNFYKILEGGSFVYLEVLKPVEYATAEPKDYSKEWDKMYQEYLDKYSNDSVKFSLSLEQQILYYETKIRLIKSCVLRLSFSDAGTEAIKTLRKEGIRGNDKKQLRERAENFVESISFKLERLKKDKEQHGSNEGTTFNKAYAIMRTRFSLPDKYTITLPEWVEMLKLNG